MTMLGMDPQAAEALALGLGKSAEQLDDVRSRITSALRTTNWIGVDAEQFNDKWSGELTRYLDSTSTSLVELRQRLMTHIEQQLQASDMVTSSGPGFFEGLWNGITGAAGAIWDGVTWLGDRAWDGITWVGDRVSDGIDWAVDTWNAGVEFVGNVASSAWQAGTTAVSWLGDRLVDAGNWLWDRGVDAYNFVADRVVSGWEGLKRLGDALWVTGGNLFGLFNGSTTGGELVASLGLLLGTTSGVVGNLISGQDLRIFAQGEPFANPPVKVPVNAPTDLASLTELTMSAYDHGGVLVTRVPTGDGDSRYIVSISGTSAPLFNAEGWTGHESALDWPANIWTMASGDSATTQAVQLAMQQAGIPPGAEVLLTGHSQGGLTATTLAANPDFNSTYRVSGVVAYGAPVDAAQVPANIQVISFENTSDIVPALDMQYLGDPGFGNVAHVPVVGGIPVVSHQQSDYQNLVNSWQVQYNPFAQSAMNRIGLDDYYSGGTVVGVQIGQKFD